MVTEIAAGVELDEMVALEVMGDRLCQGCQIGNTSWNGSHWHSEGRGIATSWQYSTTGDGMLAVMESMRQRGYHASCWASERAHAAFEGASVGYEDYAATLPHAVALAALKAVRALDA